MIYTDGLPAGVAVLGEHGVEAAQAVGAALPHDVPLPSQLCVALEAGKVFHVPGAPLGLGALVGQNDLSTRECGRSGHQRQECRWTLRPAESTLWMCHTL